eukprot:scaffold65618_cov60-Phaeocystis_antarctica.AAC.7
MLRGGGAILQLCHAEAELVLHAGRNGRVLIKSGVLIKSMRCRHAECVRRLLAERQRHCPPACCRRRASRLPQRCCGGCALALQPLLCLCAAVTPGPRGEATGGGGGVAATRLGPSSFWPRQPRWPRRKRCGARRGGDVAPQQAVGRFGGWCARPHLSETRQRSLLAPRVTRAEALHLTGARWVCSRDQEAANVGQHGAASRGQARTSSASSSAAISARAASMAGVSPSREANAAPTSRDLPCCPGWFLTALLSALGSNGSDPPGKVLFCGGFGCASASDHAAAPHP